MAEYRGSVGEGLGKGEAICGDGAGQLQPHEIRGLDRRGTSLPGMCFLSALDLSLPSLPRPSTLLHSRSAIRPSPSSFLLLFFFFFVFVFDTHMQIYIYIYIIRAEQTSRSQTLSPQRGGYYLARTRIYERREGVGFVQPADRLSSTTDAAIVRCKYGIIPESPKDERDILFLVAISFTNRSVERSLLQFRTNKIIASRKISSHLTISWPEIVVKRE